MTQQERFETLEEFLLAFNKWMKDSSFVTFQDVLLLSGKLNSEEGRRIDT